MKWNMLIVEATEAEVVEKGMPLWTAIKLYRRGVRWSMAISLCLIMTGMLLSPKHQLTEQGFKRRVRSPFTRDWNTRANHFQCYPSS